jgi:hypothetical protein
VGFFLLQREYRSYSLGKTIANMEQRIRVADADDIESLKLSEKFRGSAQYIVEVEKFYSAPLLAHDLLFGLSQIKPEDLIFKSVSMNETVVKQGSKKIIVYSIDIAGDAKNLTVLDDFKKVLVESDLFQLSAFDVEIDETLQGRNAKTGIFPYRLAISLKPAAPKTEGKGA